MEVYLNLTSATAESTSALHKITGINPEAADSDIALFGAHLANLSDDTLTAMQKVTVTEIIFGKNYKTTSEHVKVKGTPAEDTFDNAGAYATIYGGEGDDSIDNTGDNTIIYGGPGNDTINTTANNVSVVAGTGDDVINSVGNNVSINAGGDIQ